MHSGKENSMNGTMQPFPVSGGYVRISAYSRCMFFDVQNLLSPLLAELAVMR